MHHSYYLANGRVAMYCDQRVCVCLCLSVCLSACISQKPHIQTSLNILYMSPVAVVRSSSDGNAIRYVLSVLGMTSCFHTMKEIGQNQRRCVCFVLFARWRHRGRSLPSPTASCCVVCCVWFTLPVKVSWYPLRIPLVTDGWSHMTNMSDVVRFTTLNRLTWPGTELHTTI